jgi:hypothetical protein
MAETPPNIVEFNQIAGLIFAQLYREFPIVVDLDQGTIAKAFGVAEGNWGNHILSSGRAFNAVLSGTIGWLKADGYTMAFGPSAFQNVILTTKGLQAMEAVPAPLKENVGTQLQKATETSSGVFDLSKIGDLSGGVIGGVTKSLGSG